MTNKELREYADSVGSDLPLVFIDGDGKTHVVNGAFVASYNGFPALFLSPMDVGHFVKQVKPHVGS